MLYLWKLISNCIMQVMVHVIISTANVNVNQGSLVFSVQIRVQRTDMVVAA